MTEIEKKALALVNEVCEGRPYTIDEAKREYGWCFQAVCRAIEQHEAFRQEVSDSLQHYLGQWRHSPSSREVFARQFGSFIIAKPDPMDLVADDMMLGAYNPRREWGAELRAAIEKRGGKIVWGEGA